MKSQLIKRLISYVLFITVLTSAMITITSCESSDKEISTSKQSKQTTTIPTTTITSTTALTAYDKLNSDEKRIYNALLIEYIYWKDVSDMKIIKVHNKVISRKNPTSKRKYDSIDMYIGYNTRKESPMHYQLDLDTGSIYSSYAILDDFEMVEDLVENKNKISSEKIQNAISEYLENEGSAIDEVSKKENGFDVAEKSKQVLLDELDELEDELEEELSKNPLF